MTKEIITYHIEKKRDKPLGYMDKYTYEEYYHGQFRMYRDENNRAFLLEAFNMQSGEVTAQDELNERRKRQGLSKRFWSGGLLKSICTLNDKQKPIGHYFSFDENGELASARCYHEDGSYKENYIQNDHDITSQDNNTDQIPQPQRDEAKPRL